MLNLIANRRQKALPLVLNEVEMDNDNNIIGLKESIKSTLSHNLSDISRAIIPSSRCFIGNAHAFLEKENDLSLFNRISSTNDYFEITFYTKGVGFASSEIPFSVLMSTSWSTIDRNGFRITKLANDNASYPSKISITFNDSAGGRYRFYADTPLSDPNKDYLIKIINDNGIIKFFIDGIEDSVIKLEGDRVSFGATTNGRDFTIGLGDGHGQYNLANGDYVYDVIIDDGADRGYWPLQSIILESQAHTEYDISVTSGTYNGNNLKLFSGASINSSNINRESGSYLQNGFYFNDLEYVPILEDGSGFPNGALLTSEYAVIQNGGDFLDAKDTISLIPNSRYIQAEQVNRKWTDINDNYLELEFEDFKGVENNQDFSDITQLHKVSNIRKHYVELGGRQLITEINLVSLPIIGNMAIFIYGQSNAKGNTDNTPPPSGYTPLRNTQILGDDPAVPFAIDNFTPLVYPDTTLGATFGHEIGVSYALTLLGYSSYFCKVAWGGKSITELSKGGSIYPLWLDKVDKALLQLPNSVSRKVLIYDQWESDYATSTTDYYNRFIQLINDITADSGVVFDLIIVQLPRANYLGNYTDIIAAVNQLQTYYGSNKYVIIDNSDISTHDDLHYTADGYITIGKRDVSAMVDKLGI